MQDYESNMDLNEVTTNCSKRTLVSQNPNFCKAIHSGMNSLHITLSPADYHPTENYHPLGTVHGDIEIWLI